MNEPLNVNKLKTLIQEAHHPKLDQMLQQGADFQTLWNRAILASQTASRQHTFSLARVSFGLGAALSVLIVAIWAPWATKHQSQRIKIPDTIASLSLESSTVALLDTPGKDMFKEQPTFDLSVPDFGAIKNSISQGGRS